MLDGIHCGDPKTERYYGVGRTSPPLAQDSLSAGKAHRFPHHQEEASKPEALDHSQLVLDLPLFPFPDPAPAFDCAFTDARLQKAVFVLSRR